MNVAFVEGLVMASEPGSVPLSLVLKPECLNWFLPFFPLLVFLSFFVDSQLQDAVVIPALKVFTHLLFRGIGNSRNC